MATVNERTFAGCGLCVTVCPTYARAAETRLARVIDVPLPVRRRCVACLGASQKGFEKRIRMAKA